MKLYIAGPLFTPGEREYIERLAAQLERDGHDCFVPHLQQFEPLDAPTIFAVDSAGLHAADAVVAWLDGPMIDDGTACELGIFSELIRTRPERHRGIVGLATDWRVWRQRDAGMGDGGLNFFVGGAIQRYGQLVWGIDDVRNTLSEWDARSVRIRDWSSPRTFELVRDEVNDLLDATRSFRSLTREHRRDISDAMVSLGVYLVEPQRRANDDGAIGDEVDFPAFVAGLVNGVFDAIVGSSIEQMEAYGRLVADVAETVDGFVAEDMSDDRARDHLAKRHPDLFDLALDSGDPETETSRQRLLATMVVMGINRIVVTDGSIRAKLEFEFEL